MSPTGKSAGAAPGASLRQRKLKTGDVLFHEGDWAEEAYLIRSGAIEILKRNSLGLLESRDMLGEGDVAGEMALLANRPRPNTARVAKETVVLVVRKTDLDRTLTDADPFIQALFRVLSGHYMSLVTRKEEAETKPPLRSEETAEGDPLAPLLDLTNDEGLDGR